MHFLCWRMCYRKQPIVQLTTNEICTRADFDVMKIVLLSENKSNSKSFISAINRKKGEADERKQRNANAADKIDGYWFFCAEQ